MQNIIQQVCHAARALNVVQYFETMQIHVVAEPGTTGGDSRYRIWFNYRGRRYDIRRDWQKGGLPLSDLRRAQQIANEIAIRLASVKPARQPLDISEYLPPKENPRSFENLLPSYFAYLDSQGTSEKHKDAMKRNLNAYFLPPFGRKKVAEITFSDIQAVMDSWPSTLAADSKRHRLAALKNFGSYLRMDKKLGEAWVFPHVRGGRKRTLKTITRQEQFFIISEMPAHARPVFTFLARSGCRPGEVMALKWMDIDFAKSEIHIRRAAQKVKVIKGVRRRGQIIKELTKTGMERKVPLTGELKDAINAAKPDIVNPDSFVFLNANNGLTFTIHTLETYWKKATEKCDIDVPMYEGTKHSLATQLLADGAQETEIQRLFGHTSINMTRKYMQVLTASLREMLERQAPQADVLTLKKID